MDNQYFEDILNKTAQVISTQLRSIPDKDIRLKVLKQNAPSKEILKRIHNIAIEKQDYEVCAVIKEYATLMNMNI